MTNVCAEDECTHGAKRDYWKSRQPDGKLEEGSVRQWWELVYRQGRCVELRIIPPAGTPSAGYFDDVDAFLEAVRAANGKAQIYTTINPLPIAFMARGVNTVRGDWRARREGIARDECDRLVTARDSDIGQERIFCVDVDPTGDRPTGTASTEEELNAAFDVAAAIKKDLWRRGIPSALGMSGNGYYVLVRIPERDFSEEARRERRILLKHFARTYGTADVEVDTAVANASRIMKVLGTRSIKGDDAGDYGRPHRTSCFVTELPAEADLYGAYAEDIARGECLPTTGDADPRQQPGAGPPEHSPRMHGAGCEGLTGLERARRYLARVAPAVQGKNGSKTTFRAACVLVQDFALPREDARQLLQEYSNRCEPPWSQKELDHKLDDAIKTVDPGKLGSKLGDHERPQQPRVAEDAATLGAAGQDETPALSGAELNYQLVAEIGPKGKEREVPRSRTYDVTLARLMELAGGRLGRVKDTLFVKPATLGGEYFFVSNASDLFAHLGTNGRTTIDWRNTQGAMTKLEAFAAVKAAIEPYEGIDTAPEFPPRPKVFYNHPQLPDHSVEADAALATLVNAFCPETAVDKVLILTLFLTAFWGGPPGQKPGFVVHSKEGRGVGKSILIEMLARLLDQGIVEASTKDKGGFEALKKRLLSPTGLQSRIVRYDNETGRVADPELASQITAPTVSGYQLYTGEGTRVNNIVWAVTLNAPAMDSDMAHRCIPIRLGRPPRHPRWATDLHRHIDANRWRIVTAIGEFFAVEPVELQPATRWAPWESEILGRLARSADVDIAEIQETIVQRQREFDAEADESELIVDELRAELHGAGIDPDADKAFLPNTEVDAIVSRALDRPRLGRGTRLRIVQDLVEQGKMPELSRGRNGTRGGRGYYWTGRSWDGARGVVGLDERRGGRI